MIGFKNKQSGTMNVYTSLLVAATKEQPSSLQTKLCVCVYRPSSAQVSESEDLILSGPKNHDSHRRDRIWRDFSPLDFSLLSPDFRGLVLLNCT